MTPSQIMKVLQEKNLLLTQKNDEYLELAEKRAEAERNYHISYRQEMLKMKSEGTPVTIIKDLVKGVKVVADLKFKFDVAGAVEKACLESMKDIREAIGAARSILTWLREEKANP